MINANEKLHSQLGVLQLNRALQPRSPKKKKKTDQQLTNSSISNRMRSKSLQLSKSKSTNHFAKKPHFVPSGAV